MSEMIMNTIELITNEFKQRNHELLEENEKLVISFQNNPNNLDLLHKILENNIRLDELTELSLKILTSMMG